MLPAFFEQELPWLKQTASFVYPDLAVQDVVVRAFSLQHLFGDEDMCR